jgi:ABC-2 type transport system permease protein
VKISLNWGKFVALTGVLALVGFALSALGFLIAWKMDSTQGFHAVMNLILMPMWLLSGSFFPASGAPAWIRAIIYANPLTYGVAALRRVLYLNDAQAAMELPPLAACLGVTVVFAAAAFAATTWVASHD